jgi:hypothetical protein
MQIGMDACLLANRQIEGLVEYLSIDFQGRLLLFRQKIDVGQKSQIVVAAVAVVVVEIPVIVVLEGLVATRRELIG